MRYFIVMRIGVSGKTRRPMMLNERRVMTYASMKDAQLAAKIAGERNADFSYRAVSVTGTWISSYESY